MDERTVVIFLGVLMLLLYVAYGLLLWSVLSEYYNDPSKPWNKKARRKP